MSCENLIWLKWSTGVAFIFEGYIEFTTLDGYVEFTILDGYVEFTTLDGYVEDQ